MSITNKFFEALNDPKAALWSAGVAFNRSNPLPLDKWSVFQNKASAIAYAESNPVAYPGQVIAVYDNNAMQAFILAEVVVGEGEEATSKLNLQPIGIIPTGDGAISVSNTGVISLGVDNATIEVVDNALTLIGYAGAQEGAQLVKTADGLAWVKPDGSIILELSETVENLATEVEDLKNQIGQKAIADESGVVTTPASGIYANIDTLQKEKANASDVYTKEETKIEIKTQIDAIDHLKRKVVAGLESIDKEALDAEQYIYMIPNEDGAYDEYMVLEGELEKVGDWKVNLEDYATKTALQEEVDRAKAAEEAAAQAASNAQADVDTLEETVEKLTEAVNKKADIVLYPVVDEESGETTQVPGSFLSPNDKAKLEALVIDKDGNVGISGTVNASNVEGLGTWLTENGNIYITGLTEVNMSQSVLDKLNYITSVNGNNFTVKDGKLELVKISQSQVDGLEEVLASKASLEGLNAVSTDINELNEALYGDAEGINQGLFSQVSKLNTKVSTLEQVNAGLVDIYVTKTDFNSVVGNLESLINTNTTNTGLLSDKLDVLDEHLTWQNLE